MDRWHQIDELFAEALAHPPAERAAVLAACPDTEVRREVASLLDHHPTADMHLEVAVGGAVSAWASVQTGALHASVVGRRIGAYEVTGILGQGGMGAVYRARRVDGAFEHDVAIKVVRHGFETPAALDRFRQERKILARLTHPGIARLLDGGTLRDEHGAETPYVVLEFVEGVSITAYCMTHVLPIVHRVALFRDVLDAVLHAHRRLVVHRDLKPGNILVTEDGQPKLLDFGIAKLLTEVVEEAPVVTAAGMAMLTPEYASPEQIRGEPITVATDVYALGAILYELLTDRKAHRFKTRAPGEINRVVCDMPIARPSAVVASDVPGAAKMRRQLAGDLDTIVLKALHKDPARRYASIEQFSEDLRCHLAGRPVAARPDTTTYRLDKFVRRNKMLVGAVVLAVVSLIGGLVASMQQARRANQRFQDVRTLASRLLNEVEPALRDIPGTADAKQRLANMSTEYLDRLRADAGDDPDLLLEVADGYYRIGRVEGSIDGQNFGRYDAALQTHAKALAIGMQLTEQGRFDARVARLVSHTLLEVGTLHSARGARAEAMAHYQQSIEVAERWLRTSPRDEAMIRVAGSAENRSGDLLLATGRVAEAAAMFEKSFVRQKELQGPRPTITTRARLAGAVRESGDPARALTLFRTCVEETQAEITRSPHSSYLLHTLTLLQADVGLTLAGRHGPSLGATAEGLASYRAALETGQALMHSSGPDPHVILAWAEAAVGFGDAAVAVDRAGAIATLTEAVERLSPLQGDGAISDARLLDARARSALAHALVPARRFNDARTHAEAAVRGLQALVDGDRESAAFGDALVMARVHLAEVRAGLGDRAGADDQLHQAVKLAEQLIGATPDRPRARSLHSIAQSRLSSFLARRLP
jgi:serine/threonine protein kinase/tetratricopeptide (TPR) repeat protein